MSPPETQRPAPARERAADVREVRRNSLRSAHPATGLSGPRRAECLRVLERLIGADAVPGWLKLRQPALGDETGAQLLQNDPSRLLRHLRMLDAQLSGEDDEDLASPLLDRPPRRRSEKATAGVLAVLDELERRAG